MDKKNKNIAISIMSIIPIKILIHFFFFSETYAKSVSPNRRGSRRGNNDDVFQYMDENLGYYISNVFSEKLWIFLFIIILFFIAVWYFNYTKDVKIFFNFVIKNFNILRNKIDVNNNNITKNVVKNNTKTNESKFDFQKEESHKDNSKTNKYEVEQKVVDSILRVPWTKMEDVGIVSHYNGKPFNGIALHMHENGKVLQETEVVEGLKHGYSRQYHPNGQLFDEVNFENDKKNGLSRQYHENGQLEWEGISKDGNQDGLWKFYHKNGQLSCEANWNDGKKNGLIKSYYESGKLKSELNFKDGKDDGLTKFYYESGLLKQEENWKNGKKVGLTKFYDKRGLLKQDEKRKNNMITVKKKDEIAENKKIENDNSYSNKEEKYIDKMYKVKTDNGRFLNDNGDKIIVEFVRLVLEGKIEENYWELVEEIAEYFIITDFYINDKELETKVNKIHKKNRYRIYGEGDVYFEGMEYEYENEESYYELTAESTEEAIREFEKNLNITN